ncbi:MAG: hypothetical protein N4J56_007845 [Chroococcidiopsis sp. SAG 2025]|uniref:Mo-dependent nitrogenase C-terminal domain-containing protein n=1 Tax=Chroococcidiopsis sp. SAG 2025 TaxID=171389 RepID=UPI0029370A4D|nr:Mo-dependent nitrogenase C-terminal domain-containing protein [Chroococcidiopsis sp. SAG 2025]MDV2998140.1 hypothetical protein [Chroococcidiopsis sp. SAG 2025]
MIALQNLLQQFQRKLDALEVRNAKVARLLCQLLPASCPFERDLYLFSRTIAHIPPLCKLNPFYEQLVGFRAQAYLANIPN